MENKSKFAYHAINISKIIMLVLTLIYHCTMVILSGAGLYFNRESYGEEIKNTGILMIFSGIIMTFGSLLCVPKKNILNIFSLIFSCSGFIICMRMLYKLCEHADRAGWSDKFSMTPISDMYKSRVLPCIVPFVISVAVSLIQLFSYEAAEQRRLKKLKKDAPAPKIID